MLKYIVVTSMTFQRKKQTDSRCLINNIDKKSVLTVCMFMLQSSLYTVMEGLSVLVLKNSESEFDC